MGHYSPSEIRKRRAQQIGLGFDRPGYYDELSDAYIASIANGVGDDGLPTGIRSMLTKLLPYADLAADIHDVEYARASALGPEGKKAFMDANDRFRHNCRLWIVREHGRYSPMRYIQLARLSGDMDILNSDIGWRAWVESYKRNVGIQ